MGKKRPIVTLEDFSALEEPHPYGVLPGGNRFFGERKGPRREEELLSDTLWQQVLTFCDATTLGRVVQGSRYLYVAGHQPELWRDLVLRHCDSEKIVVRSTGPSWKDTFVQLFIQPSKAAAAASYAPHMPISVPGIYSDDYYRTHLCRSFAIPTSWLQAGNDDNDDDGMINTVPCVSADSFTPNQFFENYESKNMPVIVRGAARGKALEKWQDPDYLRQHNAASKSFRTTSGAAPLPADFTLDAYQEYCQFSYLEESPLYLFDRTAFDSNEQWSQDYFPDFYEKCPYWDPSAPAHGHDLLQHLGAERRPDHTWLIMGPKRSGSVFHIDPNATHAWNACVQGRKRWIMYPPGFNPPGVFPSSDGDEVALPLSVGEWIIEYWKEHMDQYRKRPPHQRPMECTVHPGDVAFVPHGWWHMVINLDDRNIAITHNYVSPSNLGNVLKLFSEKQDQISGCRDREETVKPEQLYDEFTKVLQEKEPRNLEKALSQKDWTCRAWNDGLDAKENNQPSTTRCKKRPLDDAGNGAHERKSIMTKRENVAAFTFSFL